MKFPLLKLSLRLRLTVWYSLIVAVAISLFGFVTYRTVESSLYESLDASMKRVAYSLESIIQRKQEETNKPLAPPRKKKKISKSEQLAMLFKEQFSGIVEGKRSNENNRGKSKQNKNLVKDTASNLLSVIQRETLNKDSIVVEEEPDEVWSAVYERILLNSKNFYIQISTPDKRVIYWKSPALGGEFLPAYNELLPAEQNTAVVPTSQSEQGSKSKPKANESDAVREGEILRDYTIGNQALRLYALNTTTASITVGYTQTEIKETLGNLFGVLKWGIPIAILLALVGGYLLARYSLRQVDVITASAQDITAHNLSMRLPMPAVNDEIGRLTTTLNEMIERLESGFAQIRQFTSDASHELRTPLAIMMGELELMLRRDHTVDEYQIAIASALEEVGRLTTVVTSLLEISRAESGQVKLNVTTVNISKIASDVCEDCEFIAEEKDIKLKAEIQPYVNLTGDAGRLHQLLLNVIDNAIKYTQPGGEVGVKLTIENTDTKVVVTDNGIGISEDDIPHIFDRFYRADKSRTRDEAQGNGLGLSIVKWIVEAHKGTIVVTSTIGKGTTFTITLPAVQQEIIDYSIG
jgi:heavy metal sensor kinase